MYFKLFFVFLSGSDCFDGTCLCVNRKQQNHVFFSKFNKNVLLIEIHNQLQPHGCIAR